MKDNKPVLVILAIFLPFLAVYFASEGNPKQMVRTLIAFVGSCVFFVPGLLYALDIVLDWKAVYPKIDELIK